MSASRGGGPLQTSHWTKININSSTSLSYLAPIERPSLLQMELEGIETFL